MKLKLKVKPSVDAPYDAHNKANLRLDQLRQTLQSMGDDHGIHLELIDMGTKEGGTFPIHQKMYDAISEIPGRLKPEIIAILKDAGAAIDGGKV